MLLGPTRRHATPFRFVAVWLLVVLAFAAPDSRGEGEAKKHYLTFQVSYFGSANESSQDAYGQSETNLEVNDRFSGRVEVRPTEAYDLPTNQSEAAQVARMEAMQAAVLAGDVEKLTKATPPLQVTWFSQGDQGEITGTIAETKRSSASEIEHGETRANSGHSSESYRSQKVFGGSFVNALVKIHPEEKTYDIQFTLMPDMATTMDAVHQTLVSDHKEEGHDSHSESEANVPLDMGPGQMALGYSNYQIVAEVKGQPLAGDANELIGTTRIPVPKPAGWDGSWDVGLIVSWQIDVTLPPVELVITIPGYDEWRPEGNIKEVAKPGNKLVARATVVPKAAQGTFVPRVKNIRFQLLDSSREPGVCMNWPLDAKDKDYDLRLAAASGGTLSQSDQKLEVTEPHKNDAGQYYAETQIDSYDFGGRGSLQAICLLNDGREIEGVMKDVGKGPRLPKMKNAGWVADSWKKAHDVEKLADDDDNEKIEGQNDNGDGFTLYEEYRGWVENGKHIEGDPKKKDFFVLNLFKAKADAQNGINLFAALSKLRVHSKLRPSEMSETTRLMNGNHREAPHNKAQHGVWVKQFASKSELGDNGADTPLTEKGVAGRPGITKGIGILARNDTDSIFNQPFNLPARDTIFAYDRAIAHELLHSVGVEHHGSGDSSLSVAWVSSQHPLNKVGRPYFRGMGADSTSVYTLLDEMGHDLATQAMEKYSREREKWIAMEWDQLIAQGKKFNASTKVVESYLNTPEKYANYQVEELLGFGFGFRLAYVGETNGEHSGDQDCVIRYYFAKFYEATGRKNTYYLVTPGTERIGIDICHSGKGTGINAPKPPDLPQSRYGDAASDAGNCFGQICPNDAIPPRAVKK